MDETEKKIANALVLAGISRGYTVSVNDGEEWVVNHSKNIEEIMAALGSTDMDIIRFTDIFQERIGSFLLIWGNGGDLVSDHTANDACEELYNDVNS